jgi:hypothetical protein
MIKQMMSSGIDLDEISLISSKVTALTRKILEREVDLIRADMDEAQAFLTKVSANFAQTIKKGEKTSVGFIQSFSIDTDNLVRARSLQAGAIKRLELLLTEATDTVTKSKLVGLLETQKAAVDQIDGTLNTSKRNKIVAPVAGLLLLGGGLVGAWMLIQRRRKPAVSAATTA